MDSDIKFIRTICNLSHPYPSCKLIICTLANHNTGKSLFVPDILHVVGTWYGKYVFIKMQSNSKFSIQIYNPSINQLGIFYIQLCI